MWGVFLLNAIIGFGIRTPSVLWYSADGTVVRRVDYKTGVYEPLFAGELESLTRLDHGHYHAYAVNIINKTIVLPHSRKTIMKE